MHVLARRLVTVLAIGAAEPGDPFTGRGVNILLGTMAGAVGGGVVGLVVGASVQSQSWKPVRTSGAGGSPMSMIGPKTRIGISLRF